MMVEAQCDYCHVTFARERKPGREARFCSDRCRVAASRDRHKIVPIQCDYCHSIFSYGRKQSGRVRYCSDRCRVAGRQAHKRIAPKGTLDADKKIIERQAVYKVYALIDPRDEQTYYIGVTHNVEQRYNQHVSEGRSNNGSARERWLFDLHQCGMKPLFEVLAHSATREIAELLEGILVRHYREAGMPLTNTDHLARITDAKPLGSAEWFAQQRAKFTQQEATSS